MNEGKQDALLKALQNDHTQAELEAPDRIILDYAAKLTTTPQLMNADDADALRRAGLDDRGIHDVCAITAYFNFVNRVADGLGVELES